MKEEIKAHNSRETLYKLVFAGLMSALVYIGNYFQIQIPNGGIVTRIHLGNSMCVLSGLLFGGAIGGVSSGIGAGLFDLMTPAFVSSAPYTFFSKFAMGFTSGLLGRRGSDKKTAVIAASAGQLVYIALYLLKTYVSQRLLGEPVSVAFAKVKLNALTSSVNGVLSVITAVPLYFALSKALTRTGAGKYTVSKQ